MNQKQYRRQNYNYPAYVQLLFCIAILLCISASCQEDIVAPPVTPSLPLIRISADSDTLTEGHDQYAVINLRLTGTLTSPATVEYTTTPGSAKEGADYEPLAALLFFATDEASHEQSIFIEILDDENPEDEEYFEVQFTVDTFASLAQDKLVITIKDNDSALTDNDFPGYVTPRLYDGWTMFWADEFGGNALNLDDWTQANSGNWFNNELQYYKPENTLIDKGLLTITAKPEFLNNHNYTSSRMWSHHKVFFKYGRIDIRARLPFSQGLWPALWMMGENRDIVGWPECGEIDIMELRGHTPNTVSSTIHYKNSGGNHQFPPSNKHVLTTGDFSDEFHVFSMIWNEHKVEFFVDDELYNTIFFSALSFFNNDNPFLKEFYILMNVAVGGNFGGNPDATTIWPQKMEVDYVRVFQKE